MKNCICYNLRLYRQQKGLSQQQLADILNVSRACITQWECGSRFPKYSMLIKIANLLQVPVEALINTEYIDYNSLSEQEQSLVKEYRNASPAKRKEVCFILGISYKPD